MYMYICEIFHQEEKQVAEEKREAEKQARDTIKTPPPMPGDDSHRQEQQRLQDNEELRQAYDEHIVSVARNSSVIQDVLYVVTLVAVCFLGAQDAGAGTSAPTAAS